MSTLPYGVEWRVRDLSKKSLLNCWEPAHRAGGAINTCESTGGHSHDHAKRRRKIWILEFLCGLLTFKKNGKGQRFTTWVITFPALSPSSCPTHRCVQQPLDPWCSETRSIPRWTLHSCQFCKSRSSVNCWWCPACTFLQWFHHPPLSGTGNSWDRQVQSRSYFSNP